MFCSFHLSPSRPICGHTGVTSIHVPSSTPLFLSTKPSETIHVFSSLSFALALPNMQSPLFVCFFLPAPSSIAKILLSVLDCLAEQSPSIARRLAIFIPAALALRGRFHDVAYNPTPELHKQGWKRLGLAVFFQERVLNQFRKHKL